MPRHGAVVRFAVHPVARSKRHTHSPSATAVVIIPARYQSTRFPGKPLADIVGRPMIEHVYRHAEAAQSVHHVLVATDDPRIQDAVTAFGGDVRMTSASHTTGTDRLAAVAQNIECDLIVNVQGDEPLIEPSLIDESLAVLVSEPTCSIATVHCPITDPVELADPNVVKVVVDRAGNALFFSRAAIPHHRSHRSAVNGEPLGHKHIGLYVYRRDCLLSLARLKPTPLERIEQLEQLRALESGYRIRTIETVQDPIGVDTPDDLQRVRRIMSAGAST